MVCSGCFQEKIVYVIYVRCAYSLELGVHLFFCFFNLTLIFFFFFFFQAEDGIRDLYVTVVQTCALPIFWSWVLAAATVESKLEPFISCFIIVGMIRSVASAVAQFFAFIGEIWVLVAALAQPESSWRSEERRVGKECRAGGGAEQQKQKDE